MSRIGKRPVVIAQGAKASVQGRKISVEGPKGKLAFDFHPRMKVEIKDNQVKVERPTNIPSDRALHGLTRAIIQNMVNGVTKGYSKELDIVGVGFKAQVKGKMLTIALGYTHDINYEIPEGVDVKCANPTHIVVSGPDKRMVGQVAADIRRFHEPEPYKGKGVMYTGEQIRRKQGKTVG